MKNRVTSFYVETLILILVFVAVILSLTQIFGMARKQSEEAKLLTRAVSLAQNAAEAFSAAESPKRCSPCSTRAERLPGQRDRHGLL